MKELPFYDELKIVKTNNAFSGYARTYKIEIVDKRDVIVQLKSSDISLKELFKDLLVALKGFKYQVTLKALLSKVKSSDEIEYNPVYFNSFTKTVINEDYKLDECFNEIIFRLENWISHGSGWIVEEMISQYLNLSSYLQLSGSTYVKLPKELSYPMKGLINIQNNDNKCSLWCHVRHLNCKGKNLWRISGKDREISRGLNYSGIEFPVSKKDYSKISMMNGININLFCYANKVVFPVYLSDPFFNSVLDLLLIGYHYGYIKDFNRLVFNKNKCKNKKWFVKLEKGFIEFKNFNRQIPVPFRIYADFECLLKEVDSGVHKDCFSYTGKYQDHIPCSFAYKVVCIDDKYTKNLVCYRGKNAVYKFIQCIFKEYDYCRPVMKKHFNKNLVMTAEESEEFERSNCWICGKLIENEDKVREHCHITGNYRGSAHWSCNINLKITKKVPVIFHNLRGYDSHLIFSELSKRNCRVSVIPNGLEKYMSFSLNKNIVFIDGMLFLNRSLDKLVKNLSSEDLKCLSGAFSGEELELVEKKRIYPYEYMDSFAKFKERKLPFIE